MQLVDSSERADTLLSKRAVAGFEPVPSWLRTRGTNHYTIAAIIIHNNDDEIANNDELKNNNIP